MQEGDCRDPREPRRQLVFRDTGGTEIDFPEDQRTSNHTCEMIDQGDVRKGLAPVKLGATNPAALARHSSEEGRPNVDAGPLVDRVLRLVSKRPTGPAGSLLIGEHPLSDDLCQEAPVNGSGRLDHGSLAHH